ncbi:MAG: hypothetical protein WCE58_04340 [Gallionella sp.]
MLRFDNVILLVSGIPATGKSTFAKYLVQKYNFTHFDLEQPYQAWPDPDLHAIWDQSRSEFVKHLRSRYKRVVLDWGFPQSCLSWVQELQSQDVHVVWFTGNISQARKAFIARSGSDSAINFDNQVSDISSMSLPESLNCTVIPALSNDGVFLSGEAAVRLIFDLKG